jgi:RsmE family RNA methyltransferase
MNLILFEQPFERVTLEASDARAEHLRKVVRVQAGSKVYLGFVGGARVLAVVKTITAGGAIELEVIESETVASPLPIDLLIGLPRPHTAKRILFEAASMGVWSIHFVETERGEPSYLRSSLWSTDEWKERLWLGAEQGFTTHLPEVAMHADLQSAITCLQGAGHHLVLDNYEASVPLASGHLDVKAVAVLAIGSERGWTGNERDTFRKNGWKLVHLGEQVLRVETACTAGVAAVASTMGYWR